MHLLPMVGGIYYSKLTKRNMPKHNYVLHIGTRAQCNRFHNGHLKNQTICNRRIFVWIQSDTFCLCGDNKQDILSSCESRLKSVILKPRNPVYTWFLERKFTENYLPHWGWATMNNTDNLLHLHKTCITLSFMHIYTPIQTRRNTQVHFNTQSLTSCTNKALKQEVFYSSVSISI